MGGLKNRKLGGISLDFSSLLEKQVEFNVMIPPEPNPGYDYIGYEASTGEE
jgi:hypothetical protein